MRLITMKSLFFASFLMVFVSVSFSQTGTLKGIIVDELTKDEMVSAKVFVLGTSFRTMSDIYGTYKIENIPVGEYDIEVTYSGYKSFTSKIQITNAETTLLNISLSEDVTEVDGVQVVASRKTNTETAIVLEIKEARSVVSGISREQMARSTDKTAAEAMQRIPGITIIDSRFAIIRGVNPRYNSVVINNVVAPSTEIDRRTFSFDMLSSGSLDRMMIYKTASPEYPGDFAGGVIKLYTLSAIDKDFFTVKVETGYRAGTTFNNYQQAQGSKTDFLGFDNSYRQLPGNFPLRNALINEGPTSELRRDAARSLNSDYMPVERMAIPNIGLSADFGKIFKLGGSKKLTTVNSINYSQTFQSYERKFHRYQIWTDLDTPIQEWFDFTDQVYQKDNKVNIMSNWILTLNSRSSIKFSNLFNQIGENEAVLRDGDNYFQSTTQQNSLLGYKNRTIYTGQIEGIHKMGENEKNRLSWVVGGSYLGELEPDLRRFRRFADEDGNYFQMFSPSSNLFDNSRYYGQLSEFTVSNGVNYVHDITKDEKNKRTISAGYYADYRNRGFSSRYFSTTYPGFFDPTVLEDMIYMSPDLLFAPDNYRTQDGLILQEGTRPIDAYTASNLLNALYLATDLTFGKINVSGGVRAEYNIQKMTSQDDFGPILVNNPVLSILPSTNFSYSINEKNLVRAAYGRTVNRPEFRELAPFLFYDYKLESSRVGNPNLKTATIDNIDIRYENYPRPGETFSFGTFYKRFTNPIEDRLILTTEQSSLTFVNADFAYAYGVEVEFKKSLKDMTSSDFFNKLSVNFNASYIFSQVDLGETATAQDRVRSLQGQSPYIVNAALYYNNNKKKINASLIYNVFGRNIFAVGDVSFPTMYELERHMVDFTFAKGFENGVSIKAAIHNILDAPFRFYQDSTRSGKIDDEDHVIIEFRRGSLFSFSVTYDLKAEKKKKSKTQD